MKKPHTRTKHFTIFAAILAVLGLGALAWTAFDAHASVGGHWRGHNGIARACEMDQGAAIAAALVYGQEHLDITAAQQTEWSAFADALHSAGGRLEALCGEIAATPATAPDALALAETATLAGLEAIRDIRPSFDALYAVLDADQRALVDEHMARHRE